MTNFVIPQVPLTVPKDQKVVAVGIARMLVQSEVMRRPELAKVWYVLWGMRMVTWTVITLRSQDSGSHRAV